MTSAHRAVFLLDVDNTLLDNDRVARDLRRYLDREVGPASSGRYWEIYEALRAEVGYADYLGALQRYRIENARDTRLTCVSSYLIDYPFANRLYPQALDVIEHLGAWGPTVVLSDGDVVFQPRKIERAGLRDAVDGRVLIYVHKEHELDEVERLYAADHYVLVDDKLRILTAVKQAWGPKVTTVFPKQGRYAHDPQALATYPPPDLAVDRIGDLLAIDPAALVAAARAQGKAR